MSETALASFLMSTSNEVIPREPQDYVLDRPLNEYLISSSHNTYLIGRQVAFVYISLRSLPISHVKGQHSVKSSVL